MSFRPMSLLLITASIDYLVTVDRAARISATARLSFRPAVLPGQARRLNFI